MSQSSSHGHATQPATQLFLAQSTTATQGGAFKPATMGGAVAAGQPVTSMATVITQGGSSQASHHPTQIVAGVAPIGKMQIGNATTTLSIKPVRLADYTALQYSKGNVHCAIMPLSGRRTFVYVV